MALLAMLVAIATANRRLPQFALELLLLMGVGLAAAHIPILRALARAAIVPFAATFAAISWLGGEPGRGLSLALKSYISALAVLLLVSTTPIAGATGRLRGFRSAAFPARSGAVSLSLSVLALRASRDHGAGGSGPRRFRARARFRASAGALGTLFAQSYARAENIHRAMLARGFSGSLPGLAAKRFRPADALFLALASAAPWALRCLAQMAPVRP